MKKKSVDKKCRAILEEMLRIANTEGIVSFEEDFGENTLTILVGQAEKCRHTHVGYPGCSFEGLVDSLHQTLVEKRGLSWI